MTDEALITPLTSKIQNTPRRRVYSGGESYGTVNESDFNEDGTRVSTGFTLTVEDLENLMESQDLVTLEKHGGVDGICQKLDSDLKNGIEDIDNTNRIAAYGTNTYPEPPRSSWFELFFEAFQDVAVIILTISAVVSLGAGLAQDFLGGGEKNSWIEGVAIIGAVLIVAVVSATNNYSKDLQFRALKEKNSDRKVRAIRNGEECVISIFDVLVGDVCVLHTGNKLPADGLFIPGFEDMRVDESSLTGEADHKSKNPFKPFLFAECNVTKGSGRMLVTAVGKNSKWGRTLALVDDEQPPTPLQEKLEDLVVLIGKVGLAVAALVFVVLVGYYIAESVVNPHAIVPCENNPNNGSGIHDCSTGEAIPGRPGFISIPSAFDPSSLLDILRAFIIAVTIVVVAIPEGLPLAVTISLAYSMQQMMKDQNLVRHLSACETMGGATNICSDKTGTLTENRMTVVAGIVAGKLFSSMTEIEDMEPEVKWLLIHSCCVNNEDGSLRKIPGKPVQFLGNITECALLVFAEKLGTDYRNVQERIVPVKKWGFTSGRKRMSTAIQFENGIRLFVKGASEIVLQKCNRVLHWDGSVEEMPLNLAKQYQDCVTTLSQKGLRTLCLAYRDFPENQEWGQNEEGNIFEEDLVCVAIVGIEDPLREEVPNSVRQCQHAGITVRMVTGDNILTASKIATDCGILTEGGQSIEGPDFAKLSDSEVDELLPHLQVLARSSPSDKYRLVTRLIAKGEVVAVTGDGTNDGPALSAADVGLAMGIAGTEVAKQAADIIILDDNFASIVKSVMWGRCVYDNIRKFIQFQLTVNVVALIVAFIGAVTDYGTPLTAVQLLWVNLIMDTMAALALGTERPTLDLLNRKPYGRSGKLITWIMWRNIIGHAVFQISLLFAILYAVDANGHHLMFPGVVSGKELQDQELPSVHYTMVFNTFVFFQVFNEINARRVSTHMNVFSGIFTNPVFCGIIVITAGVQALIVEFGGNAIHTVPLNWIQWFYCIGIAYMTLPYGFLLRLIPVPLETWEKENDDYEQL